MNKNTNGRSKQLLDKVYDHLDAIDVSKLSMRELEDFLGVVQKGQFLETYGQTSALANFGFAPATVPAADKPSGDGGDSPKE